MTLRAALIAMLALTISACSGEQDQAGTPTSKVGSDRDAHGCVSSAGYSWCASTASCERPWELASEADFENTPENFRNYCLKNQ